MARIEVSLPPDEESHVDHEFEQQILPDEAEKQDTNVYALQENDTASAVNVTNIEVSLPPDDDSVGGETEKQEGQSNGPLSQQNEKCVYNNYYGKQEVMMHDPTPQKTTLSPITNIEVSLPPDESDVVHEVEQQEIIHNDVTDAVSLDSNEAETQDISTSDGLQRRGTGAMNVTNIEVSLPPDNNHESDNNDSSYVKTGNSSFNSESADEKCTLQGLSPKVETSDIPEDYVEQPVTEAENNNICSGDSGLEMEDEVPGIYSVLSSDEEVRVQEMIDRLQQKKQNTSKVIMNVEVVWEENGSH